MTFTEILTIYLAAGAPFGVYYFLKHRNRLTSFQLIVKTLLAVLFWFYYGIYLLREKIVSLKNTRTIETTDSSREKEIETVSQNLLNAFSELAVDETPTFFEYREILERYVGLTLAIQNSAADAPPQIHEIEVFRIAGHEKRELQLAGRIMHRKNFLRLQAHARAARQDFLTVCLRLNEKKSANNENLNGKLEAWDSYQIYALRLAKLLDDREAVKALKSVADIAKSVAEKNGRREKTIWKTLPPSPIINPLRPNAASAQAMPTSRRD